jgi:hypothetical protein
VPDPDDDDNALAFTADAAVITEDVTETVNRVDEAERVWFFALARARIAASTPV